MFWCFEQSSGAIKFCFPSLTDRTLTHFITAFILAFMSTLMGLTPERCSWHSVCQGVGFFAYSQDLSETDITKYAKAVLIIEAQRQQAYSTIQSLLGKNPPEIICNKPESLRSLIPEAQKVAVNYCVTSKKVVENSGLTIAEFNAITLKVKTDQSLEKRIQQAMLKLQNKRP